MFNQALPVLFLCSLCVLSSPLGAQQKSQDTEKLLALEKKWAEAYKHRDISILSSLLAEDFVITVEDGTSYGKEGYISHSADTSVKWRPLSCRALRCACTGTLQ